MAKGKTRKDKIKSQRSQDCIEIEPKTENQAKLLDLLESKTVVLVDGASGTGKTFLSLFAGLKKIKDKKIEKIIYCRSDIEFSEYASVGALPGEYTEKFDKLKQPLKINLEKMVGDQKDYWDKRIEGYFVQDLRGIDFERAFVICDECQNLTKHSIKTILTRINENTTVVMIGDSSQKDSKNNNGLADAIQRLGSVWEVGMVKLGLEDIQRNKIIKKIIAKYDI